MLEPAFFSVADLADHLRSGQTTVHAVLDAACRRIERLNPPYRAFSHVVVPDAAAVAGLDAEIGMGKTRGPLHGATVSVKGNIPVKGLPWTEGTRIFAERVAAKDAAIVAKVRALGALVLGTTTLSELAMYGTTNDFEPMGLNPWDVRRTAGGSSTGAGVAAALGMAQVNIGTDSGGSIRNPACHCGVVGFMPRIGALTTAGTANHAPSLSSVGLIGRSVADVATAFRELAEPSATLAEGPMLRLLIPRRLVERMCDDETLSLFRDALERLGRAGFVLMDRDLPSWPAGEAAAGIISLYESGRALAQMDLAHAGEGIRRRAAAAARLTADQVATARQHARTLQAAVAETLAETAADAFVTPTWPFAAPFIEAETMIVGGRVVPLDPHRNCFVRAANAIDACAITLPMGIYPSAGVPAGLHLMAPGGREERLLALSLRAEAAMPAMPPPPPLRGLQA
jgi:Asp-tRNA(Asn)/Glu-tRNA(Gln) amidotransferase A subunit family amidase